MTAPIEFYFDFVSPYSYLAHSQMPSLGAEARLRPIHVLNVMKEVGNTPTTVTCAAKGRYAGADLARWSKRYGVAVSRPDMRSLNNGACLRAVLAAPSDAVAAKATQALFAAIWGRGETLLTSEDVLRVLDAEGIDTGVIRERIDAPETVKALEDSNSDAAKRGVFGAPTIFVGDAMFFGNDRLDFVRDALAEEAVA